MSIAVTCPECENAFAVGDEMAGKRGRCPQCGGVFRVDESGEGESGETHAAPVGFAVSVDEPKSGGKRRSGGKKKRSKPAPEKPETKSGGVPVGVWAALVFVAVLGDSGHGVRLPIHASRFSWLSRRGRFG